MENKFFKIQEPLLKIKQKMLVVSNRTKLLNSIHIKQDVLHNLVNDLSKLCSIYFIIVIENKYLNLWFLEGLFTILEPYCNIVGFDFDKEYILSKFINQNKLIKTIQSMIEFIQSSDKNDLSTTKELQLLYVLTTIFDSFL